jgi:hypothetical protein
MEASVSPKKAGPGDPVTLRVVISGQGNFESMGSPALVGDDEWRSYPPSEKFQSSDSISYSGEKAYEFLLVARTDQQQTPGIRFSYLDPDTGKYEVLTQNPLPVQARAGSSPAQTPEVAPDQNKTDAPETSPTPNPAPSGKAGGASSWTSILVHPAFLIANASLGVIWILVLLVILIRRQSASPSGLRRKKIQNLKAAFTGLESCPEKEFTSRAVACLISALDTESNPLLAGALVSSLAVDDQTKAQLANLLSLDEELKYSVGGAKAPDRDTRAKILSALKKVPA